MLLLMKNLTLSGFPLYLSDIPTEEGFIIYKYFIFVLLLLFWFSVNLEIYKIFLQ